MLASQNIVIILCGNKKDLDADREVTFLEASRFAQENGTNENRIFRFIFFCGFKQNYKYEGLETIWQEAHIVATTSL